jgi:hypothetical protein
MIQSFISVNIIILTEDIKSFDSQINEKLKRELKEGHIFFLIDGKIYEDINIYLQGDEYDFLPNDLFISRHGILKYRILDNNSIFTKNCIREKIVYKFENFQLIKYVSLYNNNVEKRKIIINDDTKYRYYETLIEKIIRGGK